MIPRSCLSLLRAGYAVPEYAVLQNFLRIRPVLVNGSSLTTVASNSENTTGTSEKSAEEKSTTENEDLNTLLQEKDKLLSEKDLVIKEYQVSCLCNK